VTITDAGVPPTAGRSAKLQQPPASIFEPVVQALPVVPLIRKLNGLAINLDAARPGPGQRVQDGMQLGTDGVGEFAPQLPHPIPALPQLQMPPVLLQLLIDWGWALGADRVDYPICNESQVFGAQLLGVFDQLLLRSRHLDGV
jgi:hypothetical protein